jgi:hypothetical protein
MIKNTFNINSTKLPLNKDWENTLKDNSSLTNFNLRNEYIKHSFTILTHEFLLSLSNYCKRFNKISEVGCGSGWLTYWLRKYGTFTYSAIDDHKWQFKFYHKFVTKTNAIQYIKNDSSIDLIIMSWPDYDSPFAYNIWNNMHSGQYLLYIGEGPGGCTGNDLFHDAIQQHYMEKDSYILSTHFKSFNYIHDYPSILKIT